MLMDSQFCCLLTDTLGKTGVLGVPCWCHHSTATATIVQNCLPSLYFALKVLYSRRLLRPNDEAYSIQDTFFSRMNRIGCWERCRNSSLTGGREGEAAGAATSGPGLGWTWFLLILRITDFFVSLSVFSHTLFLIISLKFCVNFKNTYSDMSV